MSAARPGDDPALADLVRRLVPLVVGGDISLTAAHDVIIAADRGPIPQWASIRACWALTDQTGATERIEGRAERAIRRAVWPLFESGAPKAAIEEAAGRANGGVLDWNAIFVILLDVKRSTDAARRRNG